MTGDAGRVELTDEQRARARGQTRRQLILAVVVVLGILGSTIGLAVS